MKWTSKQESDDHLQSLTVIPKDSSNPFQYLRSQNFFQTDDKEQSP